MFFHLRAAAGELKYINMRPLVIFDSTFGNTKIIAETIAVELDTKAVSVSGISPNDLKGVDFLVVGSPINGWRPTAKMNEFLSDLKKDQLKGLKAAAFDTRMTFPLHGNAAKKIAKKLKNAGAEIIAEPVGFYVKGTEGPLLEGETEKAVVWARKFA